MVSDTEVERVLNFLRQRYSARNGGHDYTFKANHFAPSLVMNSYRMTRILLVLEERGLVERIGKGRKGLIWRTCFGKKKAVGDG